jgi:hypothetical protein
MRQIIASLIICFSALSVYSQDSIVSKPSNKPVKDIFETGLILDQQTVISPSAKSFNFIIQHRFGLVQNGFDDLFGLYAPSNIRLGFDVGITDKIMIGIGTTKTDKLQDLNWKIALLRQTRSGSIPLSVSYFGNVVLDAREKSYFGMEGEYKFMHRLSYFHQIIISRKFCDRFSMQVSPSVSYFNAVWPGYENIYYSVSGAARIKITDNIGINLGYEHPLTSKIDNRPSLSGGIEIGTSTHAFQLFVTNYERLSNQHNTQLNQYNFDKGEFLIGMNITVRF